MSIEKPDTSPFERAIELLQEGLVRYYEDENYEQIRDGLIQHFEFTYELGQIVLNVILSARCLVKVNRTR